MSSIYDWSKAAINNQSSDSGINWLEGQLPGTVNGSARAMMGRVAEYNQDTGGSLTAGGTANAQTVTANSAFTAYANGLTLTLKITTSNTAAATLNANGLGAKSIRKMLSSGESALVGGELQATGIYLLKYSTALNSAAGGWMLLNPSIDPATLTGTETLSNKTLATPIITGAVDLQSGIIGRTAGAISLRPAGIGSTVGQFTITPVGDATFGARAILPTGTVALPTIVDANNTDMGFYFPADASVACGIDGTHIGRFSADGVHITKTAGSLALAGTSLFATGLVQSVVSSNPVSQLNRITTDGPIQEYMTSGTVKGSVSISGSTTSFNTTSDRRLKENPRPFDPGPILDKLKIHHFDWKAGGSGYGVFAQEAVKVFPDAVTKGKGKKPWQVDYSKFVPLLLQEVQNLRAEIAKLKG